MRWVGFRWICQARFGTSFAIDTKTGGRADGNGGLVKGMGGVRTGKAQTPPGPAGASGERPEERPLLCFDGERCTIFHNENRHTTQITTPMV
jgi:hypothetical protein